MTSGDKKVIKYVVIGVLTYFAISILVTGGLVAALAATTNTNDIGTPPEAP